MKYPTPTIDRVKRLLAKYGTSGPYYGADPAVNLAFSSWPTNRMLEQILVKVVVLNKLYSTNIYNVYGVAEHIRELDIDSRLSAGDLSLVADVAHVAFARDQQFTFYSFATKYCAWHEPELFAPYDSYVDDVLWAHQRTSSFGSFHRYELRDYPALVRVLADFASYFGLREFSRKQLDKYLWLEGRLASDGVRVPD